MQTLKIDEGKAFNLYPAASPEFKQMLEDSFGKEFFTRKITDRVKTFEDACRLLHIDPNDALPPRVGKVMEPDMKSIAAYTKLIIIARALNEGWVPDWKNSGQYKYYPWFDLSSGSGLSYYVYDGRYAHSGVGSRLCFKSSELAEYAGKQFINIYTDFFII